MKFIQPSFQRRVYPGSFQIIFSVIQVLNIRWLIVRN
jgi:hypothetical protein